jgi:hypothetical protein
MSGHGAGGGRKPWVRWADPDDFGEGVCLTQSRWRDGELVERLMFDNVK